MCPESEELTGRGSVVGLAGVRGVWSRRVRGWAAPTADLRDWLSRPGSRPEEVLKVTSWDPEGPPQGWGPERPVWSGRCACVCLRVRGPRCPPCVWGPLPCTESWAPTASLLCVGSGGPRQGVCTQALLTPGLTLLRPPVFFFLWGFPCQTCYFVPNVLASWL